MWGLDQGIIVEKRQNVLVHLLLLLVYPFETLSDLDYIQHAQFGKKVAYDLDNLFFEFGFLGLVHEKFPYLTERKLQLL